MVKIAQVVPSTVDSGEEMFSLFGCLILCMQMPIHGHHYTGRKEGGNSYFDYHCLYERGDDTAPQEQSETSC
jgi:hypothetical protein